MNLKIQYKTIIELFNFRQLAYFYNHSGAVSRAGCG